MLRQFRTQTPRSASPIPLPRSGEENAAEHRTGACSYITATQRGRSQERGNYHPYSGGRYPTYTSSPSTTRGAYGRGNWRGSYRNQGSREYAQGFDQSTVLKNIYYKDTEGRSFVKQERVPKEKFILQMSLISTETGKLLDAKTTFGTGMMQRMGKHIESLEGLIKTTMDHVPPQEYQRRE